MRGFKTINEIAHDYGVHPVQVSQWNRVIQDQAKTLFEGKRGTQPVSAHSAPDKLFSDIERLKMELDWLKKVMDLPTVTSLSWISGGEALTQKCQCTLVGVARATVYPNRKPVLILEIDVLLKRLIDEEYTHHPFFMAAARWWCTWGAVDTRSTASGHSA